MCIKEKPKSQVQGCDNLKVGRFSFEELRTQGLLYVDKTEFVYHMVKKSRSDFLFCSRPRRFGKSLMCSTLDCLFRGRRDLFEGLYISGTDYDFKEYPVIHLDFSKFNNDSYEDFRTSFQMMLSSEMEQYGVVPPMVAPSTMLNWFFYRIEGQVVLIVDEYDTPITRLAGNKRAEELSEDIKTCLSNFFSSVKANSGRIRFLFITGILRLSNMSIFSEMNNLMDISMDVEYATAFGYTQEELEDYFSYYLKLRTWLGGQSEAA